MNKDDWTGFLHWLTSALDEELASHKAQIVELVESLNEGDVRADAVSMIREIEREQLSRLEVLRVIRRKAGREV